MNEESHTNVTDVNYCFSELTLFKINSTCLSSVKQTLSSYHQRLTYSRHDIVEIFLSWRQIATIWPSLDPFVHGTSAKIRNNLHGAIKINILI